MNRHAAREVLRQLKESGAEGLVAVLLLAVATTWAGVLVAARSWLRDQLLAQGGSASVVATLRTGGDEGGLVRALAGAFPQAQAAVVPATAVRQRLAEWFPELAPLVGGLSASSFPALLQVTVPTETEAQLVAWLGNRPEVVVAHSSRLWQRRLGDVAARVALVGWIAGAVLLGGCLVVVLLVIRLLVLSHADEIGIMRLIGAHEGAIRGPYLACGLTFGLAGGLLGAGVLGTLVVAVRSVLPSFSVAVPHLLALPLVGAAVGVLGAAIGLLSLPREP